MDRKVEYDNQVRNQQFAHNAGIAGQVAAPFLGAMAGSMVGGFFSGGPHAYAHEHHESHGSFDEGHVEHAGSADAGDFSHTLSDDSASDTGDDFGDADAGDFGGVFDE
jgi:hypothetical protein